MMAFKLAGMEVDLVITVQIQVSSVVERLDTIGKYLKRPI